MVHLVLSKYVGVKWIINKKNYNLSNKSVSKSEWQGSYKCEIL